MYSTPTGSTGLNKSLVRRCPPRLDTIQMTILQLITTCTGQ